MAIPLDSMRAQLRRPSTHDTVRTRLYIELSHYEPAIEQAVARSRQALAAAQRSGLPKFRMLALDNLFVAYARAGNQRAALQTAHELLALAQREKKRSFEAFANLDIAGVLDQQRNPAEAERYYRQAVEIARGPGIKPMNQATIEQEWGSFLQGQGRYAECREVVEHALSLYARVGNHTVSAQGICLSILADVALEEKKYAEANAYARQALALVSQVQRPEAVYQTDVLATLHKLLMVSSRATGDLAAALRYGEKSWQYARQTDVRQMQANVLPELIRTYAATGNYAAAYRFQDTLRALRDTLFSAAKAAEVSRLQTEFETARRQQEIQTLRQRSRIQQLEVDRERNRNRLLAISSGLLLALLAVGGGLYWQLSRSRRQLAGSEAALRRSNHTKDLLMSIVGHDLRGPVAGFQQLAPMLRHYARRPAPDELNQLADELEAGSGRLAALLDNLLHWARLQADSVINQPEILTAPVVLEEVVNLYRPTAAGKQLTLAVEVPADLPRAFADHALLATVLRNLVSNAVKFTPEGGQVTVWGRPGPDDSLTLGVRDTGVGMAPAAVARVFELGSRTSTVGTAGEQGTGLGLAVCRSFVELLGGEMQIDSREGQGTEVRFTVPAVVEAVVVNIT